MHICMNGTDDGGRKGRWHFKWQTVDKLDMKYGNFKSFFVQKIFCSTPLNVISIWPERLYDHSFEMASVTDGYCLMKVSIVKPKTNYRILYAWNAEHLIWMQFCYENWIISMNQCIEMIKNALTFAPHNVNVFAPNLHSYEFTILINDRFSPHYFDGEAIKLRCTMYVSFLSVPVDYWHWCGLAV